MNSTTLSHVEKEKDLGVASVAIFHGMTIFTLSLKNEQDASTSKKNLSFLDQLNVRRALYLALVRSRIRYASEVRSP